MPTYLGNYISKNEFLTRIGDPKQIIRAVPAVLSGGRDAGVDAVAISNGCGLEFTVLPGRGMDIPFCSYKGIPVHFFSGTGITSPSFYEEQGFGWLRSAFFGMLTTCGIVSAGFPDRHKGKDYGLHGRISNTPAEDTCIMQDWQKDEYIISVTGKLREVSAFGENMFLTRRIETRLGWNKFKLYDRIENRGYSKQPLMMIYHCNFGFPLLSKDTEIFGAVLEKAARDEEAMKDRGLEKSLSFQEPTPDYLEKVFYYSLGHNKEGDTSVGLVNENIGNGNTLGVIIRYNVHELPNFTHWKLPGQGYYVTGLEPGTTGPLGRGKEIKRDNVMYLESGECHEISIEFEFIDPREQVLQFKKEVDALR